MKIFYLFAICFFVIFYYLCPNIYPNRDNRDLTIN